MGNVLQARRILLILIGLVLALGACSGGAPPSAMVETPKEVTRVVERTVEKEVVVTATPGQTAERQVAEVESGTIEFWTLSLSPTFDDYIKGVISRFEATYPGVTVKWVDVPFGEGLNKFRNSLVAENAPDVMNLSAGWVPEFAERDLLINWDQQMPEAKALYFPGAWEASATQGESYQVPWYLSLEFLIYNRQILEEAGLTPEDLPTNYDELEVFAKTIKEKTGKYAYIPNLVEGDEFLKRLAFDNVPILDDQGQAAFNTPEAVAILQRYVDQMEADIIPREILTTEHLQMLDKFSSGDIALVVTGPQLIRVIRDNNPGLYGYLGIAPNVVGHSGAVDLSVMSLVVPKNSDMPSAAMAFALFMTNAQSMVDFSKQVSVYPSVKAALEDPFFTSNGVAIEESSRVPAAQMLPSARPILPALPKPDQFKQVVNTAVQAALVGEKTPQQALDDAVSEINAMLAE